MARKPLAKGLTLAANVMQHGTGGLNIDGCRVPHDGTGTWCNQQNPEKHASALGYMGGEVGRVSQKHGAGRWPANLIHDGSDEVVGLFPQSDARDGKDKGVKRQVNCYGAGWSDEPGASPGRRDRGSAARFFYAAKASKSERGEGNTHPTVKPLSLMSWLVRLVTPPGGTVLDPFAGSGTTGLAAMQEGFHAILMEKSPEYAAIARDRLARAAGLTQAAE